MIMGAGTSIINVKSMLPVPLVFEALKVTVNVPDAAGVPEITPVVVLMLRPAGKPLALKLVGELMAVMV